MNPHPDKIEEIIPCDGSPPRKANDSDYGFETLPDYLHDLNAMHKAEKVLRFSQWPVYIDHIIDRSPVPSSKAAHEGYEVCHATAAQRAEAFLRTIGKWEEQAGEQAFTG